MDLDLIKDITEENKHLLFELVKDHPDVYPVIISSRNKRLYELIQTYPGKRMSQKTYSFLHNIKEVPLCKTCGLKPQSWQKKFVKGYSEYCCLSCCNKDPERIEQIKVSCIEMSGYANGKSKEALEKQRATHLRKYGNESLFKSDHFKATYRATLLERYGVETVMHHPAFAAKTFKSYKRKDIVLGESTYAYQGFEDVFLKECFNLEKLNGIIFGMQKVPRVKYLEDLKSRLYYPDFLIPSENLLVEVKSIWTLNRFLKKNLLKYTYSLAAGYDFVFLVCSDKEIQKVLGNEGGIKKLFSFLQKSYDYDILETITLS